MKALSDYLQQELVRTIIKDKTQHQQTSIIQINTKTTFKEALSLLAHHNVLSLPVTEAGEATYVGWFGVMEALNFVLRTYSDPNSQGDAWQTLCKDIDTLVHRGEDLAKVTIATIFEQISSPKWITPVNPMGSVFELVELFSTSGLHRIGVVNSSDDDHVRHIVTQSDIIQLLSKKLYEDNKSLGVEIHTSIGLISNLKKRITLDNPISMSLNATTIHAFWLMSFHKVYGIAVVENDRLIANISASDVKGLSGKLPFSVLLLPLKEFIRKANIKPVLKCTWNTPLSAVIHQLALFRVHRLWVVDADDKPVGVITLSSILDFLNDLVKI